MEITTDKNTTIVIESIDVITNEIPKSPELIAKIEDETVGATMVDITVNIDKTENTNKTENTDKTLSELDLVLNILNSDTDITSLLNKFNYQLDKNTLLKLNKILNFLSQNNTKFNNLPPVQNVIDGIKEVFADGKLDLSDIPTLITLITNILNLNLSNLKVNINIDVISVVIKLIIHILIMQKIINISETEEATIDKLIDSSIKLLNTTILISNVKCSCFSCFSKKN